jgi:hypothetical protein
LAPIGITLRGVMIAFFRRAVKPHYAEAPLRILSEHADLGSFPSGIGHKVCLAWAGWPSPHDPGAVSMYA